MSILVACPGCHVRFKVSDKFAGKQGACPKCKATITVPNPDDVVIHGGEDFSSGGTNAEGQLVLKPIERTEHEITPVRVGIVAGVAIALLLAAWMFKGLVVATDGATGAIYVTNYWLMGIGLLLVSPVIAWSGYTFLRDEDLGSYQGRELWIRTGICAAVYALGWGVFAMLPDYAIEQVWNWAFVAPPFMLAGAVAAFACYDLELGAGFFHFCFFLFVTLVLRWALGLPAIWAATVI